MSLRQPAFLAAVLGLLVPACASVHDLEIDPGDAGAGADARATDNRDLGALDPVDQGADAPDNEDLGLFPIDLGITSPDLGTDAADLGTDAADLGADAADLGPDAADLGADAADLGADAADLGPDAADLGVDAAAPACNPTTIPFGGGRGTVDDPYLVCALNHITNVRTATSAHFVMTEDVDFGDPALRVSFTPIPSFSGTFDGGGHSLTNMYIDMGGGSEAAFILSLTGTVEHLIFEDPQLFGTSTIATVATTMPNGSRALIDDVHVKGGKISATGGFVGGLVSVVGSGTTVSNSTFAGAIKLTGTTSDAGNSGGVAYAVLGTIHRTMTVGTLDVTGTGWKTGGIASALTESGVISECASHMTITSTGNRVGGIVSVLAVNGRISDSYSDGALRAAEVVGGIVAEVYASTAPRIERAYASGRMSTTIVGTSYPPAGIAGLPIGVSGTRAAEVVDVYWDTEATGTVTSGAPSGAIGVSTALMNTRATFTTWTSPPWTFVAGRRPKLSFEP